VLSDPLIHVLRCQESVCCPSVRQYVSDLGGTFEWLREDTLKHFSIHNGLIEFSSAGASDPSYGAALVSLPGRGDMLVRVYADVYRSVVAGSQMSDALLLWLSGCVPQVPMSTSLGWGFSKYCPFRGETGASLTEQVNFLRVIQDPSAPRLTLDETNPLYAFGSHGQKEMVEKANIYLKRAPALVPWSRPPS
jgi:hypothetical protein